MVTTSATQLTGLSSGLDTSSIIAKLMANAAIPQQQLNSQITALQQTRAALQTLNAQFASLATATASFTGTYRIDALAATSSDPAAASAVATSGAAPGSVSFSVDAVATRQVDVTAPLASWPASTDLAITTATGTVSVTAASASLDDVVAAINGAGAGVVAMKVAAGTDGAGDPLYRLQLSSAKTGAAAAFTVTAGGLDVVADLGGTRVSTAGDARVTLWPGTAAAQTVTSATDVFTDLLPGVTLTAKAVTAAPATLTVAQDAQADASAAQSLVTAVQTILSLVKQGSQTSTSTDSDGDQVTNLGPFTTDPTVRAAARDLTDALTLDVNGVSPSSIGIELGSDGSVSFDADTFTAALASDPASVQSLFDTVLQRVNQVAKAVSDPIAGTLTGEIDTDGDQIAAMQKRSDDMTALLQQQQATLEQQFAYMETTISRLNSQGQYLQSYFDALTAQAKK